MIIISKHFTISSKSLFQSHFLSGCNAKPRECCCIDHGVSRECLVLCRKDENLKDYAERFPNDTPCEKHKADINFCAREEGIMNYISISTLHNLFLAHLFFGYIHFFRFLYNPDPCNPNPCQNGGTCNPHGPGTVTCNCPPHCAGLACEICEGNCRFLQHKNWYVNLNFTP